MHAARAALPEAHAFPMALIDDEGVVASLRDGNCMGGAKAALIAADTFLHAVITFRKLWVEQYKP